jgi:hypothetical protein
MLDPNLSIFGVEKDSGRGFARENPDSSQFEESGTLLVGRTPSVTNGAVLCAWASMSGGKDNSGTKGFATRGL